MFQSAPNVGLTLSLTETTINHYALAFLGEPATQRFAR